MNHYLLKDVLEQMEQLDRHRQLVPFNITYVTLEGEIKNYNHVTLSMPNSSFSKAVNKNVSTSLAPLRKAANHYENNTRNIRISENIIRKLSIWLIIEFNNLPVFWNVVG